MSKTDILTPQKNIFCHIFFLLIFVPNWHEKLKINFLSETAWNWKKLRKQNQSGIKFYYMWSKEFKVINSLTEISQNVDFPHFPLFEIIAQLRMTSAHPPVWTLTGRQALWGASRTFFMMHNHHMMESHNMMESHHKIIWWKVIIFSKQKLCNIIIWCCIINKNN